MIDFSKIDDAAQRLGSMLPPGAAQFRDEIEQQFRAVMRGALGKMDLVSRADFELQKAALERADGKLKALEERLQALEEK
jgi:BMFP domain-containing protein YqiC